MKKYKIFKTYSPIKMSLIEHLKSSEETQMMVPLSTFEIQIILFESNFIQSKG